MKKYLGWDDDEIKENQKLLAEERALELKDKNIPMPVADKNVVPGLRRVGIDEISDDEINSLTQSASSQDNKGGPGGMGGFGSDLGGMSSDSDTGDITMDDIGATDTGM